MEGNVTIPPNISMDWTLKQGNRDDCPNTAYSLSWERLCSDRIWPKAPELRGLGANLDWIQVRLRVSGGVSGLMRTSLRHFPC